MPPEPALQLAVQNAAIATGLPARVKLMRWLSAAFKCRAAITVRYVGAAEGRKLNRDRIPAARGIH